MTPRMLRPLVALLVVLTAGCTPGAGVAPSTTSTPDLSAQATSTAIAAERDRPTIQVAAATPAASPLAPATIAAPPTTPIVASASPAASPSVPVAAAAPPRPNQILAGDFGRAAPVAAAAPPRTPIVVAATSVPPQSPTPVPSPDPRLTGAGTTGEWIASTDFGNFGFTVNAEQTGIVKFTVEPSQKPCRLITTPGGVTLMPEEPSPIVNNRFNLQTGVFDIRVSFDGEFEPTRTSASGAWRVTGEGGCSVSGTWTAHPR